MLSLFHQAVKRNIARFPERFCFQITAEEYSNLKSQFVTSSLEYDNNHGGRRKLPYVFTEQGIAMLATVLRSETAIQVSIKIMDVFVGMRRFLANNALMYFITFRRMKNPGRRYFLTDRFMMLLAFW